MSDRTENAAQDRRARRVTSIHVEQTRREWGAPSAADAKASSLYADAALALLSSKYPHAALTLDIDHAATVGHDRITIVYDDGSSSVNDTWEDVHTDVMLLLCVAWERTIAALATAKLLQD